MSKTIKARNPFAVAAFNRHSERFAHKNKGRGGARNSQRDLIEENLDESDSLDAAELDAREEAYEASVLAATPLSLSEREVSEDEEYNRAIRDDGAHALALFLESSDKLED